MTQVIEVSPLTTEQDIIDGGDIVLIGYGSNAARADYFSTKYCLKCLLVHPVYGDEPPITRATFAPRIVMTNNEEIKKAFERYAMVVSFPLTQAFPEDEVQKRLEELINTEVI